MNCTTSFMAQSHARPHHPAIWEPNGTKVSFAELARLTARMQVGLRRRGIGPGDEVLVFDRLGIRLYAAVVAIMATGATVLFVEPWMTLARIDHIVAARRPKLFLASWLGRFWGMRSRAVRGIPQWSTPASLLAEQGEQLAVEEVSAEAAGIITFTSGSTGKPKGVVRRHGYLAASLDILARHLHLDQHRGADLCIFANFTLANLALGKTTLLIAGDWRPQTLAKVAALTGTLAPETLTCGPAFLQTLLTRSKLPSLRSVHVGGALTDCRLFEDAFAAWPEADFQHVYGSTEAEPVATGDARLLVQASRAAGLYQTLCLGRPIAEIASRHDLSGLWVSGANVTPAYALASPEDQKLKHQDDDGRLWHCMGDRVLDAPPPLATPGAALSPPSSSPDPLWWYGGRSGQRQDDFVLEQKIYACFGSSQAFVHRTEDGQLILIADAACGFGEAKRSFPELHKVVSVARIHRDPRHRARIDRGLTLRKEAAWLAG